MILGWRNWKLQHQVLSIFLIQSFALIIILLAIDIASLQRVQYLFKENSKTLMVRQNNQSTIFLQSLIAQNISVILNRGLRSIVNANYLFQYSIGLDYQYIQQPLDCIDNPASRDPYIFTGNVCYGHFGAQRQKTIQDQQYFNYTALTTSLLQMYDVYTIFYTQSKPEDQYFTQYPGRDLKGQIPHERPWYKKYMEKKDSSLTTICTPFLSNVNNQYLIAQSTGLKYLNGTIFGVIGNPLIILTLLRTAYENMYISIVDKTGLIYSVGLQNDTQIYLYNQSFTGFDQWQQNKILDSLNKRSIMVFNTLLKQNVTITARSLGKSGLILVFQSNPLFEEDKINQHLSTTQSKIILLYEEFILVGVGITLFCIIVSVIILFKILRPITEVTKIMKNAITKEKSKINLYLNNRNRSQLSSFQNAFQKMISSISQSNLKINDQAIFMNNAPCYAERDTTEHLIQPILLYMYSMQRYLSQDNQQREGNKVLFYSQLNKLIYSIQ